MENGLEQLEMLLDDTLQIVDHMVVDREYEDMLTSVKNGLLMQRQSVKEMRNTSREEQQIAANFIDENLNKLNEIVQKLESILLDDYQSTTEHRIEQYEQLSLENQMEQTETYHDKIDYLSAVKIRENINRMTEVLLQIRS
ncbi:hypothetical protein NSQ96_05385 [Caldifermentibacillus hisashii]|jgi:hypothetical protein|uniref:DUF2383 domain-containing protein n=1 Tax=Caldibacillus thermoamylovorans TaxID=35841 RepID=A0ABD4A8I1_9BACI|nr:MULTISPECIES: hypothetical protein [Bacillaceae]KIO70638.1 hypothetical protein B4166_1561 [Caldibacillus thermoamylovorans]KIO73189.1 hypothetical protein B4167_2381 [Caldibacillus thermoamylovorans]MCB7068672.1 hypothetical protein [Caldibacillus sp. 210928-DFI.2.22]MCB7072200.1 hypothetical protein [Caldibacillus sp. 210928-DFI.2.18]MCM3053914.1 hypothetical protein [Caldibacillus thermoamylovorans]